jgi:uncharacterized membrane protein YcgQ (UPF0703/DUF1980 family)
MVTSAFFTFNYLKTREDLEKFNAALGKDEKIGFSLILQTMINDNKFGTIEENVRYASTAPDKGVVVIREKMFATQINDVYLNAEDYLGKTIKLEGIFKSEQYTENGEQYCFVVRYGTGGCCGADANIGFEVAWAKEKTQAYPSAESWVEAIGELRVDEEAGKYLYLDLASLNVLNKRGKETVFQ